MITSAGAQRLLQHPRRDHHDTGWDVAPAAGRGFGWSEPFSHPITSSAYMTAPGSSMAGDLSVPHSFASPSLFSPYAPTAPACAPSAFPDCHHATTRYLNPYGPLHRPSYAPVYPQTTYGSRTNTYLYDMGTNGFQQQNHAGYLPHGPRPYVSAFEQLHGSPMQTRDFHRSHFGWTPYQGY